MFQLLTIKESPVFLKVSDLAARWEKSSEWIYHNWKGLGLTPIRLGQSLRFELQDVMDIERINSVSNPNSGALSEESSETILRVNPEVQRALNRQIQK